MVGQKKILRGGVVTSVLLLFFVLPDGCSTQAKGFFKDLLSPIQSGLLMTTRSLKAGADSIRGFGGLAEENRGLYEEVVKLQGAAWLRKNVEEENLKLRKLLTFHKRQADQLIPAEVVARSIMAGGKVSDSQKG